jgi:sialidase-1
MNRKPTRRQVLTGLGACALGTILTPGRLRGAAPTARVLSTQVISQLPHHYHGWPTLAQRKNGQLLVVCSGGREAHVCPFGRVELMRSDDGGKTWSWPRVLLDGPIDDRDSGVLETARGTLLVTTFTSLAFEPILQRAEASKPGTAGSWPEARLRAWQAARDRISAAERQKELGVWMIRSSDGGITWSARYDCLVNSPHGPVQLSDGRLLYAGKDLWRSPHRVGVCESSDDGKTWRWLASIPTRPGDDHNNYHELHAVDTRAGKLVVHVRNHNKANYRETLQSESSDGGKTWSVPHPPGVVGGESGVWGLPSHLLRLNDGRLLMSYGHRRKPFGNQARVSGDGGETWSAPLTLSADGIGGDLGYPSTIQRKDGSLVTVWYERMKSSPRAVLRLAHWQLEG